MSSTEAGISGLAVLVAWSGLAFFAGRRFGPVRAADPARGSWGEVLPWLAAVLAGLVLTLSWGGLTVFGVHAMWATLAPIVAAYSLLLADLGRPLGPDVAGRPSHSVRSATDGPGRSAPGARRVGGDARRAPGARIRRRRGLRRDRSTRRHRDHLLRRGRHR